PILLRSFCGSFVRSSPRQATPPLPPPSSLLPLLSARLPPPASATSPSDVGARHGREFASFHSCAEATSSIRATRRLSARFARWLVNPLSSPTRAGSMFSDGKQSLGDSSPLFRRSSRSSLIR